VEQWKVQFQKTKYKCLKIKSLKEQFISLAVIKTPIVVTLWGKLADLDENKLQRRSAQEPIIILFVAMSVDEFKTIHIDNSPACIITTKKFHNVSELQDAIRLRYAQTHRIVQLPQNFTYNFFGLEGNLEVNIEQQPRPRWPTRHHDKLEAYPYDVTLSFMLCSLGRDEL
ncbi:hypothetical protein ZWY2020_059182, partial [Hordeum vulgare]